MKLFALCIVASIVFIAYGLPNLTADHAGEGNRATAILKAITPLSHKVHIDRLFPVDNGLTGVWFTQDGKQWGLDYLTKQQLDSLKAIK